MASTSLAVGAPAGMSIETQMEARAVITARSHRYASLARENCDWEATRRLYEADGKFVLPNGVTLPRDHIHEVVKAGEAKFIRHHITTIDVQLISASIAHVDAYFFATTEHTFQDHWGRWRDVFARQEDGDWLIREEVIILEGLSPDGWAAKVSGGQ